MARLVLLLTLTSGCATHHLRSPEGFAEAARDDDRITMIAANNVGLNLVRFTNVPGGTLSFWSADLVDKLRLRGYELNQQSPAKSANGVHGARFDFTYTNANGEQKFYSAVLFTTDKYRFVIQLAGDARLARTHQDKLADIIQNTTLRGCSIKSAICRGAQPPALVAHPPTASARERA